MKKLNLLVLFVTLILISCERDDICAETTSTTPRLIIEFYDMENGENLKDVPRLTVYGEDLITDENGNPIQPLEASDKTLIFNDNTNIIELPLAIEEENTQVTSRFIFEKDTNLRLDDNNTSTSNLDIIEVSYEPQFEYVSRACGYKSIFVNLTVSIDNSSDTDTWISNIQTEVETVENENTVHVRILH